MNNEEEILVLLRTISSRLEIIDYKLNHMYFRDGNIPPYELDKEPAMVRLRQMDEDMTLPNAMKAMHESMKRIKDLHEKPKLD